MVLSADALVDRIKLKAQITKWRVAAICLGVAFLIAVFNMLGFSKHASVISGNYIARVAIEGVILEDSHRLDVMEKLVKDTNAKAVILYINSPGGTLVGGESLYNVVRDISARKPVVAVMGSLATSGGYMVAVAADHVIAQQGSLTGSIGVILQTAEFTSLAEKLGVSFENFKSSALKGTPSPFEKVTPEARAALQNMIDDSYNFFVDLVQGRRNIARAELLKLADGRVFTGRQALKHGLVDALGAEKNARQWLQKEKNIAASLKVKDIKTSKDPTDLKELFMSALGIDKAASSLSSSFQGLLLLWSPNMQVF